MLVLITEYLSQFINGLSVFQYITLRAIFAAMTSLVISLIFGPRIIMWLNSIAQVHVIVFFFSLLESALMFLFDLQCV